MDIDRPPSSRLAPRRLGQFHLCAAGALLLALPALAQPLPAAPTLPPGVTPQSLRGMSPAEARARYEALDPATKQAVRQAAEQARTHYEHDPALKEQLKSMWKAWKGQ